MEKSRIAVIVLIFVVLPFRSCAGAGDPRPLGEG